MENKQTSWPLVVGIGAGLLAGIVAAIILHAEHSHHADTKLRDAKDIMELCRKQIEEIGQNVSSLKQT